MGRRRTRNHGLPPHMAQKGRSYYYVTNDKRKWIPLGKEWGLALAQWARLEGKPIPTNIRTFGQVAGWYRETFKPLSHDSERELARLELVFSDSPIETIAPVDVRTYLTGRCNKDGAPAPVRANREIARLSHVINAAREHGLTDMANPCTGVTRNAEEGRGRYAEDQEFDAIYAAADELLQDAMDLLLFTGQRPSDVVKSRRTHIVNGALRVRQGKTGAMVPIVIEGDFKAALDRMMSRERKATGIYLVQDNNGQPLTYWQLEDRWSATRAKVAKTMPSVADIQMRDIRGKTATDVEDLAHAQLLLGHKTRAMTEKYVKQRSGTRVAPLKRRAR